MNATNSVEIAGLLACFVPLKVLLKTGQSVLKKGQQAIIDALFCVDA